MKTKFPRKLIDLKLDRESIKYLKGVYKDIYGKDYDGTGEQFAVCGNLMVKDGSVTKVTWFDKQQYFELSEAIGECIARFKEPK